MKSVRARVRDLRLSLVSLHTGLPTETGELAPPDEVPQVHGAVSRVL